LEAATKNRELAVVTADVLGDLAFMVNDDEVVQPPVGTIWLRCQISYEGPAKGALCCWCSRDFAIQLTANLLGIEPDESDARSGARDALREFMNILCGQLVTAWYGTDSVFNLSIPTVETCVETPELPGQPGGYCRLSICGEPFYCTYTEQC